MKVLLDTRLYYLSITITTYTSPAQMGCSRTYTLKFDNFSHYQDIISNKPPPASVIMAHCVRKSIFDSPLTFISLLFYLIHFFSLNNFIIRWIMQSKMSCINVHCDSRMFCILLTYVFSKTPPFSIKMSTKNPPY